MYDDAPPQVDGLKDVLKGLDAFTTRNYDEDDQVHYPVAGPDEADELVFPLFLIAFDGRRSMRLFIIADVADTSIGELQEMAQEFADQLPSIYRQAAGGLLIAQDPEVSDVGVPSEGMVAAGYNTHSIELTLTIGLQRG